MNKFFLSVALTAVVLAGCTMMPKYHQPAAPISKSWPENVAANNPPTSTNAVAEIGWREFFNDPRLQKLIELSLTNNRDLRVAVLNVEQTRAQYRIQRAALIPTVSATANGSRQRVAYGVNGSGGGATFSQYSVELGIASYEVDLFGRVRSLKTAALENYFASEENRKGAQIALVAEVANQYLAERELDEQLKMTQQTLGAVQNSYNLIKASYDVGASSELDLRSAESQVETAKASAASYEQQRDQAQNALVLLVGEPLPADLPPPQLLDEQNLLTDLPPGLPSDLLQRRPDILAAEHELKAANADIGAARAAFFPTITLTGGGGTASTALQGLFAPGSQVWNFSPQITWPVFATGTAIAELDAAKAGKLIQVADYEKVIQTAFREVSDDLVAKKFTDEQLADQTALVKAEQRRYDLSDARYRNGVDNYLTVLTAQQDLYTAQQNQITTQFARLSNLINLYQALGGGWQERSPQH
ncbi:MAG TPA: efflux transporter outer membrane subunit [Verrucomicrobiae bacterium]|jgi:multidrug efflux system outer membrane protein|nr:efflux transporter outer membrane subunit [Verrucomicrobiae bacterium]